MAKAGEKTYFGKIGDERVEHSIQKPYSDGDAGLLMTRIGTVMELLPPPPARILDLGCGTGWTSKMMALRGYEVVGQDISAEAIELAKKHIGPDFPQIEFVVSDYESMDYHNEFDGAFFFDSLHHAEDEALAVAKVFEALKPGGVLVTSEPGKGHSQAPASIQAVKEYGVNEKDMQPAKVIELGKKAGFKRWTVYPDMFLVNRLLLSTEFSGSKAFLNRLPVAFLRLLQVNYFVLRRKAVTGTVALTKGA